MFDPKPKSKLDIAIDAILTDMEHYSPSTKEYGLLLGRLTDLHKMRESETRKPRVSPDVITQSLTHILGILLILHYEKVGIVTTKALAFVPRVR